MCMTDFSLVLNSERSLPKEVLFTKVSGNIVENILLGCLVEVEGSFVSSYIYSW